MLGGRNACAVVLTMTVCSGSTGAPRVLADSERRVRQSKGPIAVLDFRAIGEDGQPVVDLKSADVALKVDGKAREIRSLQLGTIAGGDGAASKPALAAPFSTNAQDETGRDLLLVIDEESIDVGREQPMKNAIGFLLATLTPRDRQRS
jgi:hypothetical protein